MKTTDIKKKLIDEIHLSKNTDLLEEFYRFLNLENEIQKTYQLSDAQKSAITEAREQIKSGKYITDEKANEELEEWFKK